MGSTTLRLARLALYCAWTAGLMPVQLVGLALRRHWTSTLPVFYHRWCCRILGFRIRVIGTPTRDRPALYAANHISYADITVLGSVIPGSFIAKSEVARWPFFGWLAKLQRSVFVDRRVGSTVTQRDAIGKRLADGDALILFPEGTSGDGNRVRPFKSALFGAAQQGDGIPPVIVQPVSVAYTRLDGIPIGRLYRPFFAWYGAIDLAPHLWGMVGLGTVEVVVEFHPPTFLRDCGSRKALAEYCHARIAGGLAGALFDRLQPMPEPPDPGARSLSGGAPWSDISGGDGVTQTEVTTRTARNVAKSVYIKTYGCQMNVYDSVRMAELLAPLGFTVTHMAKDADLVILNTCHIREKAAEKVYSELGKIRRVKAAKAERGGRMIVAVAGCVAQAEGAEMIRRAPCVDLVFGPQSYHRLPELIARVLRTNGANVLDTSFPAEPKFDFLPETTGPRGVAAFLTVQEGCDKFCSFCVVPYTRGAEYSRPVMQVVAEARRLVLGGAREITLLGQNVNAYHGAAPDGREWRLGDLIRRLAELPGLDRIRYTTSHPRNVDDELIAAHRDVPQLMPFLHLPVQSGSDRILAAMNRRHTVADYRRIVERLRSARSDLALSTDLIVGHPGESDVDHRATLDLVEEVRFAQAFSFKYSPRPGTPAASATCQVPDDVKSQRLGELQLLLVSQQRDFNAACVGRTLSVLLEKPGRHEGQLTGRSPYLQSVNVAAAAERIGAIVPALITAASANSLSASLAEVRTA